MKKIKVFPLDFAGPANFLQPVNPTLFKMAEAFANRELKEQVNFVRLRRTYVACEVDDDGHPIAVKGIMGGMLKWDFPVVRFVDPEAGEELMDRFNDYLVDQGLAGMEAFVYVARSEAPEQRCPRWKKFLKRFKATNAQRWSVEIS